MPAAPYFMKYSAASTAMAIPMMKVQVTAEKSFSAVRYTDSSHTPEMRNMLAKPAKRSGRLMLK